MVRSFFGLKKNLKLYFAIYIYIYIYILIYLYISIYIYQYIYIYIYLNLYLSIYVYWKKERGLGMRSFQKSARFCILLQKNVAFFYAFCKRTLCSLRSFTFLRKERKRTHCSFGSHKSPKTRKKPAKERCVL